MEYTHASPAVAERSKATRGVSRRHIFSLRRRPFLSGLVCGVALLLALRQIINHTGFADTLVSPLVHDDTSGAADAIVVLGAGVVGPCEPNLNALRRVLLAVRLFRAQRAPTMVFTGGPPSGLPCPVSQVMAQLAMELGVPRDRVRLETRSHSTHENAVEATPILRELGARRVLVVTDRLHMNRAAGVFAHAGFAIERAAVPVYAGHVDNVSMLVAGAREFVALAWYRSQGWIDSMNGAPAAAPRAARPEPAAPELRPASVVSGGGWMADVSNPGGPVVILGASYAGGWKPAPAGGVTFVTRGVSGQQSWELLERFDRDVLPERPRAVILWGYINDFHRSPKDKDKLDAAATRAKDSFVQMVAKARAAGIEPILATEVTIRPLDSWSETIGAWVGWAMGKTSYQDLINGRVIETNAWLKELAAREKLLVLDLLPILSDERGVRRKAYAKEDGSHITPAGYAALDAYARPLLEQHFARR